MGGVYRTQTFWDFNIIFIFTRPLIHYGLDGDKNNEPCCKSTRYLTLFSPAITMPFILIRE